MDEFLRRGTNMDFYMLVFLYGMTEIPTAPQIVVDYVTNELSRIRVTLDANTLNDIQILASALAAGATLLTQKKKLYTFFPTLAESW